MKGRILVCGGRDFADRQFLYDVLDEQSLVCSFPLRIIHGGARGADALVHEWAIERGVECVTYPADWATHGRAAGPIRNQNMLDLEQPWLVIAFDGGRGTSDMVRRATKAGVRVLEPKKPLASS